MPLGSPPAVAARVPDLAPRAARAVTALEVALVLVVSAAVAFPRTGQDAFRGVMWAEDGPVALQVTYQGHHGWGELLTPYQGYATLLPRLVSSVVSYLPLSLHGLAMVGSAVAIQTVIAVLGFHVASSHTGGRIAGWIVALGVAAVPVGPETAGALVNLQWFLLFAACVAPLWEPRTRIGRVTAIAVMAITSLSSPFGLIPLAVAGLAWYLRRSRHQLMLLLVTVGSVAAQLVVMATAPPRDIPVKPQLNPVTILDSYVRRVLGDGVLGLGRYPPDATSSDLLPGLLVLAAVVALAVFVARTRGVSEILVPGLAAVLSVLTYVGPVGLSDVTGEMPPMMSGRYSVGPTLLLFFALAVLVERAVLPLGAPRAASAADTTVSRVLAAVLVAALGYGLVTSWSQPSVLRHDEPSWSSEVARGRMVCERHVHRPAAKLRIAPVGFVVLVPCTRLSGGR